MDIPAATYGPIERRGDWATGVMQNARGGSGAYLKESLKIGLAAGYRREGIDPNAPATQAPSAYGDYLGMTHRDQELRRGPSQQVPLTQSFQEAPINPHAWNGIPGQSWGAHDLFETTLSTSAPVGLPQTRLGSPVKRKRPGRGSGEISMESAVQNAVMEVSESVGRLRLLLKECLKNIPEEEIVKLKEAIASITETALSAPRPMDALYLHVHMLLERYKQGRHSVVQEAFMGKQDVESSTMLTAANDIGSKYANFMENVEGRETWIVDMVKKQLQAGISISDVRESAEKLISCAPDGRIHSTWEWTLRALDELAG